MRGYRTTFPIVAALLAGLALTGCNQSGRPRGGEPILSGNAISAAPAASPSVRTASAGALAGAVRNYAVIPGDTVYGVAGRFNVPIRTLIEANGLTPPFRLRPGQQLAIPAPQAHVAKAGETIQSIARIYGVDQSTLIRVNHISPPYVIRAGDRLRLPAPVETVPAEPAPAATPSRTVTVETLPPPGSPPSLASARAEPAAPGPLPLAPAAGAERPSAAPQTARVPLPVPPPAVTDPATAAPAASPAAETVPEPVVAPAPAADAVPEAPEPAQEPTQTAALPPEEAVPAAVPQPPPLSADKFLWPVNGSIISGFGPQEGGLHNDGINIAAPRGTPVRAVESGVVAYAGNELRGFGKLLLIRHADGWISAYAHNDALLVERGDQVTRGQVIARVGSSGNVSAPQLHFELRRGAQTVDPLSHLGAST